MLVTHPGTQPVSGTPKFLYISTPYILIIGISLLLGAGCAQLPQNPNPTSQLEQTGPKPGSLSNSFRVVGYVTPAVAFETIPFDKLTHIHYAFIQPALDGISLEVPDAWGLERIVAEAHQQGLKVLVSIGGWGQETAFESLASDPVYRQNFSQAVVRLVSTHHLDGVDIAWLYPISSSRENYLALVETLRTAFGEDLLLTATVGASAEQGEGIPAKSFARIDYFHILAHDGFQHASLNFAQNALDYWAYRGLPKGKMVLGVPFYSRPLEYPYRELVAADPSASFRDETVYEGVKVTYNGLPTIQLKTEVALGRASGIAVWSLAYDSFVQDLSLLNAIHQTIHDE